MLPLLAGAQAPPKFVGADPDALEQVLKFINKIADWMLGFLVALAAIFIVIAAYYYLTASGNQEQTGKAKSMIIYAIVAIVIGLLAKVIVQLATQLAGA